MGGSVGNERRIWRSIVGNLVTLIDGVPVEKAPSAYLNIGHSAVFTEVFIEFGNRIELHGDFTYF